MKIKLLKILAAYIVLVLISSFTTAFGEEIPQHKQYSAAVVPESTVTGVLGFPLRISCKSESYRYPLRSCRWERLNNKDGRHTVNINKHGVNQNISSSCPDCNYLYKGGLEIGVCTLFINNVTDYHAEQWECFLIGTPIDHTWIGQLRVEVKSFENAIGEPYFVYSTNSNNQENEDFNNIIYDEVSPARRNITCCVDNDARIPLTLQIHLVLPQISALSPVQLLNGSNALVTFEFSANPMPKLWWFLATNVKNDDFYFEIKNNTKYTMTYVAMKETNYTATLKLEDVNDDDFKRQFKLRISNEHGTKELPFRIVTPNPGDESDTYWMMILIGIGAALICLIFFIVLFIILAGKRNGVYTPAAVVYSTNPNNQD
ncbi:unnamed protein product [Orchesella dallaii]|uniref:Uncharacterized protein n=1 Tax=Orchesella dallaii TaxID=48710 RepID=A0ABP1QDR2_9HEXA